MLARLSHRPRTAWVIGFCLALAGPGVAQVSAQLAPKPKAPAAEAQAAPPPGFDANRHLRVSEVRPGMKGYGMTVFHGTEPEAFAVEVVSVQKGFSPGKSVVWVRCPDDRMQLTGPVQGMSGSPIYLWPAGKEQELGQGGKMIGAFAFGHTLGKDCYVGVQPIEAMLETASRVGGAADAGADEAGGAGGAKGANANPGSAKLREQTLAASFELAQKLNLPEHQTWRLRALAQLTGYDAERVSEPAQWSNQPFARTPLALPVNVGSASTAEFLEPYFRRAGLRALAGGAGGAAELTPDWIDPDAVKVRPGGVFSIPLVFGALDMAAIGTTTEVLPDGTALAFGHQFFAQGAIEVPMAPGYVHFIQPNLQASFKLGGSLNTTGAVVRDESSAVVGKPGGKFETAPVTVTLDWPDADLNRTFEYRVAHHPQLMPSLIGAALSQSVVTDVELPELNTVHVDTTIEFDNGRKLSFASVSAGASARQVAMAVVPAVATLTETDFGTNEVRNVVAKVRIEPEMKAARITDISLKQTPVEPGGQAVVLVRIQRFRGETELREIAIDIPEDLPDGNYMLMVGGASTYQQMRAQLRPHLMRVTSQAQLFEAVQEQLSLRDDALYVMLQLGQENNLALGRTELPELPSSKAALLEIVGSSRTTRFADTIEKVIPLGVVVTNQAQVPVQVEERQGQ